MPSLPAVISYLQQHHDPQSFNHRKMRLVYLCDWKCCLMHKRRLLDLQWEHITHGPWCSEVMGVNVTQVMPEAALTEEDREVLDFVLAFSAERGSDRFDLVVRSTFPLFSTGSGRPLDLLPMSHYYLENQDRLCECS